MMTRNHRHSHPTDIRAGRMPTRPGFQHLWGLGLLAALGMVLAGCKQRTPRSDPMVGEKPGEQRAYSLGHGVECEFRWVPPGQLMSDRPAGRQPTQIAEGFWIAAGLITEADWGKVTEGKIKARPSLDGGKIAQVGKGVARVSWYDCKEFLGRLKSPDPGWIYELPGVAEWEHACRAGSATPPVVLPTYGAPPGGGNAGNAWSIRDMHGDVEEWCRNSVSPSLPEFAKCGGPADRDRRFSTTASSSKLPFLRFNRIAFRIVLVKRKPEGTKPAAS